MINLTDKINRLIKTPPKRSTLKEIAQRPAIDTARGKAPYRQPAQSGGLVTRREVVTVYSSLIITEAGAYEKPPNWPTSGAYPGSSFQLDTEEPYYEQQRVHLVIYDVGGVMQEDRYLVQVAQPFSGIFQGISNLGSTWTPAMFKTVAPGTHPQAVQDRIAELTSIGVA